MSEQHTGHGSAQDHLAPAAEAEWARFRRHLELAEGFWLTFVFANSPATVRIFEQRTERVLRASTRTQVVFAPATPETLAAVTRPVLDLRGSKTLGCVWISAVFADAPGEQDGPWIEAWSSTLLALNQSRQRLRNGLTAGLVIAAPAYLKPRVRAAAPDLWSIRTLVLDLAGTQSAPSERESADENSNEMTAQPTPSRLLGSLANAEVEVGDNTLREFAEQLRRARGLNTAGETTAALELGHHTVAQTRSIGHPPALIQALIAVADIEQGSGDRAAASQHVAEATRLARSLPDQDMLLVALLKWNANLAAADDDHTHVIELLGEAIDLQRRQIDELGETQETLRELGVSLDKIGDAQLLAGNLDAATAIHQEALTITRRILDTYGETPQALRDLSISLERVGDTQLLAGDLDAATTTTQEALDIRRRILDTYGNTPQALRDLSISLNKVGDTQLQAGQLDAATAAYQETLDIRRQILDTYGETPQALRDLNVSLDKVGDTQLQAGQLDAATTTTQEALDIARRILDTHGDTPRALRDLSISLNKVGDIQLLAGDLDAATTTAQEALDIRRRILDTYGDTPQALRDTGASLDRVGNSQLLAGDLDAATTAYQEALDIARRILDTYGDTPQALRDLNISLNKVGDAQLQAGQLDAATTTTQEALDIARRILDTYGETPQALRDLNISLEGAGNALEANGDANAGSALLREAETVRARLAGR